MALLSLSCTNCNRFPESDTHPFITAGLPITKALDGTSFVTNAPAATIAHSPIVTPQTITHPAPRDAPYSMFVLEQIQSELPFKLPSGLIALGCLSLVKVTLGPINTPCRNLAHFTFEAENLAMLNFMEELNSRKDQEIIAYFNYHSVMGKMYQRPVKEDWLLKLYNIDYEKYLEELENKGYRVRRLK